jgi:hypothetical protein
VLNAKGGENTRPKQKDHIITLFSNFSVFQIGTLSFVKSLLIAKRNKTCLCQRGRKTMLFRGAIILPKEKHLRKGENFLKLIKCF